MEPSARSLFPVDWLPLASSVAAQASTFDFTLPSNNALYIQACKNVVLLNVRAAVSHPDPKVARRNWDVIWAVSEPVAIDVFVKRQFTNGEQILGFSSILNACMRNGHGWALDNLVDRGASFTNIAFEPSMLVHLHPTVLRALRRGRFVLLGPNFWDPIMSFTDKALDEYLRIPIINRLCQSYAWNVCTEEQLLRILKHNPQWPFTINFPSAIASALYRKFEILLPILIDATNTYNTLPTGT